MEKASSPGPVRRVWIAVRGRIISGALVALPLFITFWVLAWLYSILSQNIIAPIARLIVRQIRADAPSEPLAVGVENYGAPALALVLVVVLLYALGFFVRSRLRRYLDWFLLRVPVVTTIYNGVSNVFKTLENQRGQKRFDRAVLVAFPHPGMRVPGFVMATCRDLATGRTVLCVYVPTTPIPTSGFMLLIPEEEVTELNWSVEDTLQAIVSCGLTAPQQVRYFPGDRPV